MMLFGLAIGFCLTGTTQAARVRTQHHGTLSSIPNDSTGRCMSFLEFNDGACDSSGIIAGSTLKTWFSTSSQVGGSFVKVEIEGKSQCYVALYESRDDDMAEAHRQAVDCCINNVAERNLSIKRPCVALELPDECARRNGVKSKGTAQEFCACPKDRPHLFKAGEILVRDANQWSTETNGYCIDECYARQIEHERAPSKAIPYSTQAYPVVFLAVYSLGFGIVHSNLAFCPDTTILNSGKFGNSACLQPDTTKRCGSSWHTDIFAAGNAVPNLLQDHGCRELIYDGNRDSTIWSPERHETGCWVQGMRASTGWQEYKSRKTIGQQRLYWLTSENSVQPFGHSPSLEHEMSRCFGTKLGNRLDYNRFTYSLLHHNCNKFSSEAMRFLDLPLFFKGADKGKHKAKDLSSTEEESRTRRVFQKQVNFFTGETRDVVSARCQSQFIAAKLNCRRVRSHHRKGDCPIDEHTGVNLRCYNLTGKGKIATKVGYQDPVNGKCAVPRHQRCSPSGNPCKPSTRCIDTKREVIKRAIRALWPDSKAVEHAERYLANINPEDIEVMKEDDEELNRVMKDASHDVGATVEKFSDEMAKIVPAARKLSARSFKTAAKSVQKMMKIENISDVTYTCESGEGEEASEDEDGDADGF